MKLLQILSLLLLSNFLSYGFSSKEVENPDEENALWIGPYLQNVTRNSIVIMWETTSETVGYIEFGEDPVKMTQKAEEDNSVKIHELKITNLQPGKTYYYQCKWDGEQTPVYSFSTAPPLGTDKVKIVVYGDTRSHPQDHAEVAQQIAFAKPDLVLHSGDFVMYGADQKSWKPQFFDPVKPFCSEIPILTVLGNHERNTIYYYNFYALNNNEAWWSTDYGPVHIIGLDSNQPGNPGSEQYKWLINDLENNRDARWIMVMFHHPLFSSRPDWYVNDLRWQWHPVFQKYNVDLVFNGDDHYYSRSFPIGEAKEDPVGVTYIISAGGGAPLYPTESREYTAYRRTIHHFTELEFNDDQMVGKAIDAGGNVFDSFILNKNSYVGTDEFYAFDMLVLEETLKRSFKMSSLQKNDDEFSFDFNLEIPTSFQLPVSAKFRCISDNWEINNALINGKTETGNNLEVHLSGTFKEHYSNQFPELEFEIRAIDTMIWKEAYSPAGFKNTRISFNLEQALYLSIMESKSELSTSQEGLTFLEYFNSSQYANSMIDQYWKTVRKEDSQVSFSEDMQKITHQKEDLRYYPIQFLLNDFSRWEEWMKMLDHLPVKERSLLRDNLVALPGLGKIGGGMICNWHIAGVFDNPNDEGFFRKYAPEDEINLKATYKNSKGETIKWTKTTVDDGDEMNFANMFDTNIEGVVYAYCEIQAEKKCKVPLLVGSDDGIVIWVNGKEIYRYNEARGSVRGEDIIVTTLKQGKNKLLVKVNQFGGGWGLFVDILDKDNLLELPKE